MPEPIMHIEPDQPVDFHMHTRSSDGGWTPEALVDYLADHEFRVIAVCDHDTMRSVPEVQERAAERGIRVIPGLEFTTWWDQRQWHLLVYGIDPTALPGTRFGALLSRQQDALRSAAERAIALLERHGYSLPSLEEVVDGRPLLPVHVLLTMIKDGHAPNLRIAHERVREVGESLRVDSPLEEVVAAVHEAGGICIIAHPGRDDGGGLLTAEQLDRMLATIPVDGLECHYRSYTDEDTAFFRALAAERGLLMSSGSDSHAPGMPVFPRPYPAGWVAPFLSRFGVEVAPVAGEPWYPGAPFAGEVPEFAAARGAADEPATGSGGSRPAP